MDDRMYFVFFALLLVILAIVIPFFLKAEQPNPCKKSLVLKQTCSTVFILNALIAGLIGDFTRYAALMFVGLCFSWLGDYLLHVRPGSGFFVAGLSYIILVVAAILSAIFIVKIELGKLLIPCILYTATIAAMVVKAFSLAIMIMKSGSLVESPIFTGIMLMLGAFLFMLSDYTLSILNFKPDVEKHGALRQVNIWTYFYAQMFLGATIFFIST